MGAIQMRIRKSMAPSGMIRFNSDWFIRKVGYTINEARSSSFVNIK